MTTPALESALAKLRECADMTMFVEVNHDEAAALLAKIEAADKWQALMSCERIRVLGSCLIEGEDYGHIGLEVWTHYADFPESADRQDREILERFIERAYRNPQPAGGGKKSGEFAPAPPDKTYQHALVRRLWEAQLGNLPDGVKRLMAEAATEIEGNLPATDDFVNAMRRKHAKVTR